MSSRGLVGRRQLGKVECEADNMGRIVLCWVEELEQILQVAGCLVLQEALLPPGRLRVPSIVRLLLFGYVAEPRADDVLPLCVDSWLVEKSVDDVGVVPVRLCPPRLVVEADMIDVTVHGWQKGGTESASPCSLFPRVLDDLVSMRARLAVVACLVMLVESVRSPEYTVAVRTRILLVSLVKFILVPLPVELSLELGVASVMVV